jgi:hypothetical protein
MSKYVIHRSNKNRELSKAIIIDPGDGLDDDFVAEYRPNNRRNRRKGIPKSGFDDIEVLQRDEWLEALD